MISELQALFNEYQQKYLLYQREAIVDIMLNDGVITFEDAEKIKTGASLFEFDNTWSKWTNTDDVNFTEIMGGNFSSTNPKTSFNRRIESTKQPMTQGDCWLLADINALSYTTWGKQVIQDAIIPDEDGNGGVTIRFKGSPLEQKEIHITAKQIDKARKSGNYAEGDDDVIAFELATEETFREMVKQGLAERAYDDKSLQRQHANYRSYIWGGVRTDKFKQYPISELLGIPTYDVDCLSIQDSPSADKDKDRMLKFFSQNKDKLAVNCGFALILDGYGDKNSKDYIHGGHAYAIKDIAYGKEVVLTDPHYSDYEIKIPYDKFKEFLGNIVFSFKDTQIESKFKKYTLPQNYEENYKKFIEKRKLEDEKNDQQIKEFNDSIQAELDKEKEKYQRQTLELKQKENERINSDTQKALQKIEAAISNNNLESLTLDYNTFNSDTIMAILDKYPKIVLLYDKAAYGWGNGNHKRELINPIIEAISKKAQKIGIDENIIYRFTHKCYSETNAIIYTNEKVIQSEIENMIKLIKTKEQVLS